ncbi:MAG: 30S ribosomal protein S13 [Tenericutes bacterium]|nr:30S ribosomal protein S13 [Mycoplasmatota bacterium]
MARIKNIDLPKNKRIVIALTYIYGIGSTRAKEICAAANVDENKKTDDLTIDEINNLRAATDSYVLVGDLKREVDMNIKTKMEINSYQGTRHKKGLPVRGQHTSRNARTRKGKGKTIANKKK